MARYSGNYQLDSGVMVRSVRLTVFGVNLAEPIAGSPFGGSRFETRPSFDADYLPQALVDNIQSAPPCCEVPVNTIRHARAYYSDTLFLYIPCPYRGDTNDFLAFFTDLVNNPAVILVESHGETVGKEYALLFAERP